jgi:site-specific DNA recombinase
VKEMKENCIVINRVSSLEQASDGYSLNAQSEFGNKYASDNQFKIVKEFTFSESGSKRGEDRKFNEIIRFIEEFTEFKSGTSKILNVIVEKPDRWGRLHHRKEILHDLIKQRRVILHYYREKKVLDHNCSPQEILIEDVMTSLNKYTASNIGREAKKGMLARAKDGWLPSKPPAGYRNNPNKEDREKIIVNEEEREYVNLIFELRSNRLSYQGIVDKIRVLNKVPDKRLKTFRKSTVEKILKNPFYMGNFEFCGEVFLGKHEIIIPKHIYERAQNVMKQSTRKTVKKHKGLFSDLFVCEDCGCKITYHPKKKPTGLTYHLYVCANGKKQHETLKGRYWKEERLQKEFENVLDKFTLTERMAELISEKLNERHIRLQRQLKGQERNFKQYIENLDVEEDLAYEKLKDSVIDDSTYKKQIQKLRERRNDLQDEILKIHKLHSDIYLTTAQTVLELAKNAKSLWRSRDMFQKVELMEKVLWNSTLSDTSVEFNLKKPFKKLSEVKENQGNEKWGAQPTL